MCVCVVECSLYAPCNMYCICKQGKGKSVPLQAGGAQRVPGS